VEFCVLATRGARTRAASSSDMGCGASKIEAQVEPSSSGKPVAQPQREPAALESRMTPARASTEKVEAKLIVVTAEPPASDRPAPALPPKPLAVSVPAAPAPTPAPNVPKKLVLILGGPGTGVSGQCAKLAEVYGCHHLLVGKLMRSEVMSESDEGRSIAQMMNDGKIIPAAVYASLFKKAIAETPIEASAAGTATATFLVDGFPRSADNAKLFAEHVGAPSAAVVLFVSDSVAHERLRQDADGATGAESEEAVAKRLASYAKRTLPMVEALEAGGLAVKRVDASTREDAVFAALVAALGWELPADLEPSHQLPLSTKTSAAARVGSNDERELVKKKPSLPKFSLEPAEDVPLASVTGSTRVSRAKDARTAYIFLGSNTSLIESVSKSLAASHGFTVVGPADALASELLKCTAEADELRKEIEGGKLVPPAKAAALLDQAMVSNGPYLIPAAGAGSTVLQLLSNTVDFAPLALCFGPPAEGESMLAASFRVTGRELHVVVTEDAEAALADVSTKLGLDRQAGASKGVNASEVVFVLGGPGSGKGTQCALLTRHFGYAHFSAGDLLRDEVASGSEQGLAISDMIKEGKIVPAQTTIDLLQKAMQGRKGPYLIDGFPRSMDNAKSFEAQLGVASGCLFFDVSEQTLEARLLERGKTSGRTDDNQESILKRFKTFQLQSMPVVDYLATITTVHKISGEASQEEVFAAVCKALDHAVPSLPASSA